MILKILKILMVLMIILLPGGIVLASVVFLAKKAHLQRQNCRKDQ